MKSFTYNPLFDREITLSVKEVKEKNTFCKGCARTREDFRSLTQDSINPYQSTTAIKEETP